MSLFDRLQTLRQQSNRDMSDWNDRQLQNLLLSQILHKMEKIMSVISDFGTAMTAYFDETGASIDELKGSVAGLSGDVAAMKAKIDELQNSPGAITPEDQKILNDLQARAVAASANAKEVVAQVKALDEQTPPVVPPEVLNPPV